MLRLIHKRRIHTFDLVWGVNVCLVLNYCVEFFRALILGLAIELFNCVLIACCSVCRVNVFAFLLTYTYLMETHRNVVVSFNML